MGKTGALLLFCFLVSFKIMIVLADCFVWLKEKARSKEVLVDENIVVFRNKKGVPIISVCLKNKK